MDAPEFVPICAPAPSLPVKILGTPPQLRASSSNATDSDHSESLGDSVDDEDVAEDGHTLSQNYLYHRYVGVLEKALNERAKLGPGNSPLVATLYPFWVTRLTHKFNRNMYRTFTRLAVEDVAAGNHVGNTMQCVGVSRRRDGRAVPLLLLQLALHLPRAPFPRFRAVCSCGSRGQHPRRRGSSCCMFDDVCIVCIFDDESCRNMHWLLLAVLTLQMLWLFMKDHPSPEQDAHVQCYPDLVMAMDQLETLGRFLI